MANDPVTERGKPAEDQLPEALEAELEADHGSTGTNVAGTTLTVVLMALVIFGLSLWLVPMAAPHLPASIAKHIMPGQQDLNERMASIEALASTSSDTATREVEALRAVVADLTQRIEAAEQVATDAVAEAGSAQTSAAAAAEAAESASVAESVVVAARDAAASAAATAETATTAATEAGKVASTATRDTAALARQITSFEARLGTFNAEMASLQESIGALLQMGDEGISPTELAAAVASLQSEVARISADLGEDGTFVTNTDAERFATQDDLRSARNALSAEIATGIDAFPSPDSLVTDEVLATTRSEIEGEIANVRGAVNAVSARADEAVAAATAAQASSAASAIEVGAAIEGASIRAAGASVLSQLLNGQDFSASLTEIAALSGTAAPSAAQAAAEAGVATAGEIAATFDAAAQAAVTAELEEQSGGSFFGRASAQVQSFLAGRPTDATDGDTTEAVLSRMGVALSDGDLAAASAETSGLSEIARNAMADWIETLETRLTVEAETRAYLAEVGALQG